MAYNVIVDIPISTFKALPQAPGVRNYVLKSPAPDIALINPSHDNSPIDSSGEINNNAPSYAIPAINAENEKVDPFLDKFYHHLNVYREKYNLVPLARDIRVEKLLKNIPQYWLRMDL